MKEVIIYASGSMEERVIYSTAVFSTDNKNRRSNISNSLDKHFPFDDLNSTGKQCPSVGAFTIYCVFENSIPRSFHDQLQLLTISFKLYRGTFVYGLMHLMIHSEPFHYIQNSKTSVSFSHWQSEDT